MNKLSLYIITAAALISLNDTTQASVRSRLNWNNKLTEAYNEAAKTGRPIVIFFRRETSSNSHPGEVLQSMAYERDVITQRSFESYAGRCICVKLFPADLKPGTLEAQIASHLKIEQFPMLAVLEISGGQVHTRGIVGGHVGGRHRMYPVLNAAIAAFQKCVKIPEAKNPILFSRRAGVRHHGEEEDTPAEGESKPIGGKLGTKRKL